MSERTAPLAVVLVRNPVSNDARVLREDQTLRDLGFDVIVIGVVSTAAQARETRVGDARVIRLDPAGALRALLTSRRRMKGSSSLAQAVRTSEPTPDAAPAGAQGVGRSRLRRVTLTASFYVQAIVALARLRPALVHANDYNTMWIGVAAKLLWGSRLIYDCHELWPDRNGRPESRPWLLACEALFMRIADRTITASPGYASEIARRYRVSEPTVVRNIPVARDAGSAPGTTRAGMIVYVGGLMPGRGLEPAIMALAQVKDARLELIGPGTASYRQSLLSLAHRLGVADRLTIAPPVAPSDVVSAVAHADAGLMLIEPICRSYELTLPNKLFEYAGAGVPMLASDLTVIGAVVREHGLGELVVPSDIESIVAGMRRMLTPEFNEAARERVRAFAARETWARERRVLEAVYEGRRA